MTTKTILLSAVGLGGTVVGGYYAVEALTDERVPPRNTIWRELRNEYTRLSLDEAGWQKKFKEFKEGDNSEAFAKALKEGKEDSFKVEKDQDNEGGGKALSKWCEEVLDLEKKKATETKSIANAKLFCVELKKSQTT